MKGLSNIFFILQGIEVQKKSQAVSKKDKKDKSKAKEEPIFQIEGLIYFLSILYHNSIISMSFMSILREVEWMKVQIQFFSISSNF